MSEFIDPGIASQFDRLPPHSIDAEMSLLGSIYLDKKTVPSARLIVDREQFYQADHQIIFDCLLAMYDRGMPFDAVSLVEELKRRQLYEEVGGGTYIASILRTVPSSSHWEYYAKVVREKSMLRQLIGLSNDALRDCYKASHGDVAASLLSKFATEAMKISATGAASNTRHISEITPLVIATRNATNVRRLATGLRALDEIVGGFPFGQKVIIAGRTYMGKSAILKFIANRYASAGWRVGIISIEESGQKIATNLLSLHSKIPNNRIAYNTASESDWEKVVAAQALLDTYPIFIEDSSRRLSEIEAAANNLVARDGCQIIMVDHLHIIDGETDANREQELSKISAKLKWVWKSLGVIGIEAAQLSRANLMANDNRPSIHHLRGSGSLEQDADVVLLLHREDYYKKNQADHHPDHILEIIVAKNKDGAPGVAPVFYDECRYDFRDLEAHEQAVNDNSDLF